MQFQKISILPPQKGLEFPEGGGCGRFCKAKNLKKCMKLNWNFQRGVGGRGLGKNPFHRGTMIIFWNYNWNNFEAVKNIFMQEKIALLWLTFNPGLALTGFQTTQPNCSCCLCHCLYCM